jgi:hypothetical protein
MSVRYVSIFEITKKMGVGTTKRVGPLERPNIVTRRSSTGIPVVIFDVRCLLGVDYWGGTGLICILR